MMPHLPPPGIFIPTRMIFDPQIPSVTLFTWIQLRCLAWDGRVTSPLSMQELTQITGKSQATLYRHISLLRHFSVLSWLSTAQGKIILSFPDVYSDKPKHQSEPPNDPISKCQNTTNS